VSLDCNAADDSVLVVTRVAAAVAIVVEYVQSHLYLVVANARCNKIAMPAVGVKLGLWNRNLRIAFIRKRAVNVRLPPEVLDRYVRFGADNGHQSNHSGR